MIKVLSILVLFSIAFAQTGWQRLVSQLESKMSASDTVNILATKYDLSILEVGGLDTSQFLLWSDTLLSNGVVTDHTLAQRVDCTKVLYWSDTSLTGGVATNADVLSRADSSTALYWSDTTLTNGPITNYDFDYRIFNRSYGYVYKNPGQTTASTVGLIAPTLTATVASNDQTNGAYVRHTSASTANTPSGLISANFTVTRRDHDPDFYALIRTGTAIDSLVYHIGLTSAAFDSARIPNRYEIKFRYFHTVDGTTWQAITNNNSGGSQTVTNTGVTVSINTNYSMRIICSMADNNVKFYINDALVATHTTQLPTSTQTLGYGIRVVPRFTTGTSGRIINWGKVVLSWNG